MQKKFLFFLLPGLAFVFVGVYILQINAITALAYHITEAEHQIRDLKEQTTALEVTARQGMSLGDLQQLAQDLQFEKVQSISYVKIPQGAVAQNSQ